MTGSFVLRMGVNGCLLLITYKKDKTQVFFSLCPIFLILTSDVLITIYFE